MALAMAIEEGGTDARVRRTATAMAKRHYRAILRRSTDGQKYLDEIEGTEGEEPNEAQGPE
jgi:hypothetical protein